MIKWRASRDDKTRDMIGLGLEAGNVEKLMEGKPIYIDGSKLGIGCDILIHYGPTTEAMIDDLQEYGFELPPGDEWKRDD